jgi:hypothetical protein
MVFFKPLTYNFTVTEGFALSLRNREVWSSNPSWGNSFFSHFLSQINIELNISVAISLIANLLQLKHWKALVALYKNKLVYNLRTFTFLTFWDQTNSAPPVLWLSYAPDKEKEQRAITLKILKMELWLLYTALPLIALAIVWSCIEFQQLIFKLCTGQKK